MLLTQLPHNLLTNKRQCSHSQWWHSRFSSHNSQCSSNSSSLLPRFQLPVFLMTCLACLLQPHNQLPRPRLPKEDSNLIRPVSNPKWWTTRLEVHQIPLVRCSRVAILEPPKAAHPTQWMPWAAVSKCQASQWAHKWRDLPDSTKTQMPWPCNNNSSKWWWCSRGCSRCPCRADSRTLCRFNRCSSRCKWWWARCSRWWCRVNNLALKAWASRCRHKAVWVRQVTVECSSNPSLTKCRTCNKCLCSLQRLRIA